MRGLSVSVLAAGVKALSIPPETAPSQSILIISEPPSSSFDPCLHLAYYGAYGGSSTDREYIFLPTEDCLVGPATSALSSGELQSGSITYIDPTLHGSSGGRLVWVGQAGVTPDMVENESGNMLQSWAGIQYKAAETTLIKVRRDEEWNKGEHQYQSHYTTGPTPRTITMIHASAKSLLLAVPEEYLPILDTLLPRHLVPVALPLQPYATTTQADPGAWEPVPDHLAKNLANITKGLKFDPKLDKVMNDGLEVDQLRRDIRWLTGEGPSGIESRHSFTEGALKAAKYIKGIAEDSGASCELHHFLPHFAPNVLCTYPSTHKSTDNIILSAHYDSRGSFGLTRAPGGDDDGSGSGHLLQIARAVGKLGIRFEKKVTFAWHAGEEQGLYGSHYFAERLKKENATVLLQIQADMLGYHAPGEPLQLGLPESIETPEASALLHALAQLYSPELVLGKTAACCSDHQSFLSYGFPATAVFERNGPIADPMYHNTGDVSQREGYDLEQILSIAKVTMGAVLTVAGWKRE